MPSGVRIVISDTGKVTQSIQRMSDDFDKKLVKRARDRADSLRVKLRLATAAAYTKSGTGRFSRGLNTKLIVSTGGGRTTATIQATMIQYRESEFLTEFGGRGGPPRAPYYIFAKGAHNIFDTTHAKEFGKQRFGPQGEKLRNPWFRAVASIARKKTGHRLQVPLQGYIGISTRSGRERRQAINGPAKAGDPFGRFYYPLWVRHPGFPMGDVVLDTIASAAEQFKEEAIADAVVSFNPAKASSGISFTGATVVKTASSRVSTQTGRAVSAGGLARYQGRQAAVDARRVRGDQRIIGGE